MNEKLDIKKALELSCEIFLNLASPKMWGLKPEKGWCRPCVIEHEGEYYCLRNPNEEVYFEEAYSDFTEDIKNGVYVPTGIKVNESYL